jgi:catechol 2,3-dioxygenase-like lactoylglutathione lyase family enzyme
MNKTQKLVECIIPILKVENMTTSLAFYVNVLGFKQDWLWRKDDYAMASISRDHCDLYLCEGDQGNPGTWIWIGVADVLALFEDYKNKEINIIQPPTNYSWACEMRIGDPDGHILRIGSESLPGVPFND